MADSLYDVLAPYFDSGISQPLPSNPQTVNYLTRLTTLSLPDLISNEAASLSQSALSHLRNLQALSKRSHKTVIASTSHLTSLSSLLPSLSTQTQTLSNGLPELEAAASKFAHKYSRISEREVLDRRKQALLLSRNADRVADVLELPSLLSSTVSAAQAGSGGPSSFSGGMNSYSSALDLNGHIKRLTTLFPHSDLVEAIAAQSETEIQSLAAILILSLQSPSLKLAGAMRAVGWLKRIAPELVEDDRTQTQSSSAKSVASTPSFSDNEGALGSLFLLCRLRTLNQTLEALDPLRELADQETARTRTETASKAASTVGSQSERFVKRYIEIFREQSFSILNMYRNIFPTGMPVAELPLVGSTANEVRLANDTTLSPLPAAVSSFALHLVDMLFAILREYMPNITDKSARESLLTQVLYCAGSLGRLGADFGLILALLEEDLSGAEIPQSVKQTSSNRSEWIQVMKKHRVQANRLEVLARGVGGGKKAVADVTSPALVSPPLQAT